MAHGLANQNFHLYEDIAKWSKSWKPSKDELFFRNGVCAVQESWENFAVSDGQYFEWLNCS